MSEIHGAVGSYVVNALDGAELSEFEAHLAVCETCRREVMEFSETAGYLGSLVETPPPPALRGSILAAIQQVRPLPPETAADAPAAAPRPARLALAHDADTRADPTPHGARPINPVDAAPGSAPVDELAVRRSRRTTRLLTLVAAAALVVALAMGGWVANLRQDRQAPVAVTNVEAELLAAPDLRVVTTKLKNGGEVSFRVSRSLNKALIVGEDLPSPGAGKEYQLWTIKGTKAAPDSVFGSGEFQKTWLSGDVRTADGAAVTIEPRGGSPVPTLPTIGSVEL
jgi:hypothetical protein